MTKIEWTDETWNPVTGCTKVSAGCKNCYAERLWPKVEATQRMRAHWEWQKVPPRPFTEVKCHPERLDAPLQWKKPRRVFVNSMSDLFHEDVPGDFIDQVITTIKASPRHTFQVLTKRPERMKAFMRHYGAIANLWLGVSVEDQATADERIPLLLQTPAAVRFLSCEPLRLMWHARTPYNAVTGEFGKTTGGWSPTYKIDDPQQTRLVSEIDWVIAGGESGPHARPTHPDWFRSLRDQCEAAGVPFFFKQWGELAPICELKDAPKENVPPKLMFYPAAEYCFEKVGKKAAGRLLDGKLHDEYPA